MSSNSHVDKSTATNSRSGQGYRSSQKTGVMLINLGTPDEPTTTATRRYLKQFLSDPRVLDIPAAVRYLLLRLIILPFRPSKSAEAYRLIWTEDGSPIMVYGRDLVSAVQSGLDSERPDRYDVRLAMRYGNPSIESVLREYQQDGVDRIIALPLYPQYASATVGSTLEELFRTASTFWNVPDIQTVPVFYDNPSFIEAWRKVITESIDPDDYDHLLFSFHGLPERHVKKSDLSGGRHCLVVDGCCDAIGPANRFCYRAQCVQTAKSVAAALGLSPDRWTVSFQSRLGRDPWLRPYTDELIRSFPDKGVKRLAMISPAFVADCLETIEELGIRGAEDFKAAGGEKCTLVPSLNVHPAWVEVLTDLVRASDPSFVRR